MYLIIKQLLFNYYVIYDHVVAAVIGNRCRIFLFVRTKFVLLHQRKCFIKPRPVRLGHKNQMDITKHNQQPLHALVLQLRAQTNDSVERIACRLAATDDSFIRVLSSLSGARHHEVDRGRRNRSAVVTMENRNRSNLSDRTPDTYFVRCRISLPLALLPKLVLGVRVERKRAQTSADVHARFAH